MRGPRISDDELSTWRAFLNAHATATASIEEDLRAAGRPPLAWYDVLWPLHRASGGRLRMGELSDEVVLSRTGMTRLVDRIEGAGLLRREPVPDDRRGAYAVITPAGERALRDMWPVYARGIRKHFLAAVAGDAAAVRAALERVAHPAATA